MKFETKTFRVSQMILFIMYSASLFADPQLVDPMIVTGDVVNIRKLPSKTATVLTTAKRGDIADVIGHGDKPLVESKGDPRPYFWYKVTLNKPEQGQTEGWIYGAFLGGNSKIPSIPIEGFPEDTDASIVFYDLPIMESQEFAPVFDDISFPTIQLSSKVEESLLIYFITMDNSMAKKWPTLASVNTEASLLRIASGMVSGMNIHEARKTKNGDVILTISETTMESNKYLYTITVRLDIQKMIAKVITISRCTEHLESGKIPRGEGCSLSK
jgi:hypothetical protein